MVRELGLDAAEARPEESAYAVAPKTAAANKIEVKFFMGASVGLERGNGRGRPCEGPCRVGRAFSRGQAIVCGTKRQPLGPPRSVSEGHHLVAFSKGGAPSVSEARSRNIRHIVYHPKRQCIAGVRSRSPAAAISNSFLELLVESTTFPGFLGYLNARRRHSGSSVSANSRKGSISVTWVCHKECIK